MLPGEYLIQLLYLYLGIFTRLWRNSGSITFTVLVLASTLMWAGSVAPMVLRVLGVLDVLH